MRAILEKTAYKVLEAKDYEQALSIYRNHQGRIDLVLTDIALPGLDGCELVRTLLELRPELCALFVSGMTGAEMGRYYGLATTDVHFLAKPFSAADLLRRVRSILKTGGPYLTRTANRSEP